MKLSTSAFLMGTVAGLRSMTAPAAVSWAARFGWLSVKDKRFAFLASPTTTYILTALAIGELVADKLPQTPSRKDPFPFGARLVVGALTGAAIGCATDELEAGLISGVIGAALGTVGGYEGRTRLVKAVGQDLPVALLEDAIAISGAVCAAGQME